jgi:hypothetical protein
LFHAVSVWELPPEGDGPTAELDRSRSCRHSVVDCR